MDSKNSLKYYEFINDLRSHKTNIIDSIKKNMKKRDSMIIDHHTHSKIDHIQLIIQEISKLNDINEHTTKWMNGQMNELKRLDFKTANIRGKLTEHDVKIERIIDFLNTR